MTLNKIISKRFHNFNIDVQMGTSSSTNTIRLGMLGCILVGFEVETLNKTENPSKDALDKADNYAKCKFFKL